MDFFEEATLRLKQQLKVTEDKQVAEFFGISGSAWTKRRQRGSFPVKEVFALAAQRPELALDPDWIASGTSNHMETEDRGEAHLLQCYRLMNQHDRANMNKIAAALSDVANLTGDEINRRLGNYATKK